jgi:hypothetical protein
VIAVSLKSVICTKPLSQAQEKQMSFERWGSISVDDHVDTQALVANILLYDRLVIPVMSGQADRDERGYWISKGWDPALQSKRIDQLEELAVPRPWSKTRREAFRTRVEQLKAEQHDAEAIDHKHITRMILAQEKVLNKPPGVDGVKVVAAYNSAAALNRDFPVTDAKSHLAAQAYLLTRKLAVPDLADQEVLLREAIKLSKDADFGAKRGDLFDWQELAFAKQWSPEETLQRLSEMTARYNAKVKEATGTVRWKFAFTLFGIGLGFATGGPIGAGAAAALSLVQFAKLDRKPAIEAGSTQPAAMFHDIETHLGIKLV